MTRKQINLISMRARQVFSGAELEQIGDVIALVKEEDLVGRPITPTIKMDKEDKSALIDAIIDAEYYHHKIRTIGLTAFAENEAEEKQKAMMVIKKYASYL